MSWRIAIGIALAAELVPLASRATAETFPIPTPGTIRRLERDCSPRDWLIVTTDSMRSKVRVQRFDHFGLSGIRPSDAAARLPDPLSWTQVERLSVSRSRRTRGVALGLLVGGVGTVALARSGDFFFAGALAGGALGGALGGKVIHEEDLYLASRSQSEATAETESPASTSPSVASDSAAAALGDLAVAPPAESRSAASAARPSPPREELDRIALQLSPRTLVRVMGGGTTRAGYVGAVSELGLERFHAGQSVEPATETLELISWDRINRLDRRVGSSGSMAKRLAIGFGAAGVLLGIAVGEAVGGLNGQSQGGLAGAAGGAIGGLTFGAFGGLIGAGIGAAVPKWDPVFERP